MSPSTRTARNYEIPNLVPFIAIHLLPLGALWTGVSWQAVVCGVVLYWVRMFAVTAGYHRYFAHRTFKTSRWFQFVLAFLAQTTAQRGVLWWAAHHRTHHKLSDMPGDLRSPRLDGFWYSHVGWIFNNTGDTDWDRIRDLSRYPELRFSNRFYLLPPFLLAVAVLALFGWSGLFIGFAASTAVLWHGTFVINSLAHVIGKRRFDTTDDSKNSFWLALITMGEGWHNNHHHYQGSVRQGFYWWELDVTYYVVRVLGWLGLVWDIREPPAHVLAEGRAADQQKARGAAVPRQPRPVGVEQPST